MIVNIFPINLPRLLYKTQGLPFITVQHKPNIFTMFYENSWKHGGSLRENNLIAQTDA